MADFTYTVGDTWSTTNALNWCSADDNVSTSLSCTLNDSSLYDLFGSNQTFDTAGTKTITYRAEDEAGNITNYPVTVIVSSSGGSTPDSGIPAGYYDSITAGLTGSALRQALTTRISGHTIISYDNAQYTLDEADADPMNSLNVLTIYDRTSVSGVWNGSTWNKEHVWPQSSYASASPMVSDLHHLRAAVMTTNSTRSNNYFNIISGHTLDTWLYSSSRFFPGDADKGDVARMLLYMAVRYYDQNLRLIKDDYGTTANNAKVIGDIDILLTWHQQDPVDSFEINRNNVIYGVQKNRNPFIDRPDLFEDVWTHLVGIAESLQMSVELLEKAIDDYETLMVTYTPTSNPKFEVI